MIEIIVWWIHDKSSETDVEGKEGLGNGIVPHLQKNSFFGKLYVILNENMQDYDFACGFVWMRNLSSDIKGGT
jgi:hypothetical protein